MLRTLRALMLSAVMMIALNTTAQIVITEFMYNDFLSGNDQLEFIELYNNGSTAVDLNGYTFTQGIDHTFTSSTILQPGDFLVLCVNATQFQTTFGISATQWNSGALSNGGEDIELQDGSGNVIDYLDYSNSSPWPTDANGGGPSVELCDPSSDNSIATNWQAATSFAGTYGGAPVYANPGALGCGAIPDTTAPVVIDAYAISSTTIEVEFVEAVGPSAENAANYSGLPTISSISRSADMTMATITLLTPLNVGQTYNLTIDNVADTSGNVMASSQTFQIIWFTQSSDLVITEIMYNDAGSGTDLLEYIEILNIGSSTVNLFNYSFLAGVDFTFPNHDLAAGALVVVAEDTVTFFNTFGFTPYQWDGALQNGGEMIILANAIGDTVDVVDYGNSAPWPTDANGNGPSLELCNPGDDNNDGSNWIASLVPAGTYAGVPLYATPGVLNNCNPTVVDTIAPMVQSAFATSLSDVTVVFSEPVSASATMMANYTGLTTIGSITQSGDQLEAYLSLSTPLNDGQLYTLTIDNVMDTTGNTMDSAQSYPIQFFSFTPDIVITEIMYNDPSVGTDLLEFIELYNNDVVAVNLSNYYFTEGVELIFPSYTLNPGEYVLVSYDSSSIRTAFNVPSIQWTTGALGNSGEDIVLVNPSGLVVDSVNYDDGGAWPNSPDGDGPSLGLCGNSSNNANPSNWIASPQFAGVFNSDTIYATPLAATCPEGCFPPLILDIAYLDESSVTLSWKGVPGALGYKVRGRTFGTSVWKPIFTVDTFAVFEDVLRPGKSYEWQVAIFCDTGVLSDYSATQIFTADDIVTHCASSGTTSEEWIETVCVNALCNTSGNNGGYKRYEVWAPIKRNQIYDLTLTPGYASTMYPEYWTVRIDLNKDGDFADLGELVYESGSGVMGVDTGSFYLPFDATLGVTIMRIQMKRGSTAADSCEVFSNGEVEDYAIKIRRLGGNREGWMTEENSVEMDIYPNPVHGSNDIRVFLTETLNNADIAIYDLQGRMMWNTALDVLYSGQSLNVPTETWTNGIYELVVTSQGQKLNSKLVLMK